MIVYMTDEQREELAEFLKEFRLKFQLQNPKIEVKSWAYFADPVKLDAGLLSKFARGDKDGMNWETTLKLHRAFGDRILEILGVDLDNPPLFVVKDDKGQGP